MKQKPAEPSQPAPPPQFSPAPQPKPDTGGFFNPTQDRPRQSTIIVPGTTRPSRPGEYRPQVRREGWVGGQAALEKVKSPPQHGWTGRGYFEQLRHEREARRRPDLYIQLWYYPYDYAFYCWQRYHYEPWYIWPYYTYAYPGYQYFYYYYAAPPTIILQEAFDSVYGETYVPYVTWPSNSLMEAKRDLEQAWRQERIELLERHLDPDHAIASYFRDEYTHGMSAEEFRQLTLDAFSAIRTVTFELTSARYVSTREWARLQGTHIFYDPYDERTVVDVSYLLHRSESETGRLRWVIWEVRQSPHAD